MLIFIKTPHYVVKSLILTSLIYAFSIFHFSENTEVMTPKQVPPLFGVLIHQLIRHHMFLLHNLSDPAVMFSLLLGQHAEAGGSLRGVWRR